ncbi:MAG: DUF3858 domain-containing protein [Bacteroidetes bacterium]|nr:DUF3858 domain-containing protein [Bacteroidota bacterium]MBS1974281.1 DUF3858 domain-containing protein [Bacteroidota bacterium]
MIKNAPFLLMAITVFAFPGIRAQEKLPVTFGKVGLSDFAMPKSAVIDSEAMAVIVADVGNTSFIGNQEGWFSYVFKRNTRIKIVNKNALDVGHAVATVVIPLYVNGNVEEKLDAVNAASYNFDNGKIEVSKIDPKNIFTDRIDKNHTEVKFTIPGAREGSIIEYSYTIFSSYIFNIPTWEFQSTKYPCLWSQYEITIPNLLSYMPLRQGATPFYIDKKSEGHQNYTVRQHTDEGTGGLVNNERSYNVSATTTRHLWAMKDIAPLIGDSYIFSPRDDIDKIEFQLFQTYDGESVHDVMNSWQKATAKLLEDQDFGEPILPENFNPRAGIDTVGDSKTDIVQKARDIYYYVQKNFTCTNHYVPRIVTSLSDVMKKKSGTVGEINLLLIAMLRKKAIHADPVLLSTREFGVNSPYYPVMDRLNYLVCRVKLQGAVYYLDAASPILGFGKLAESCYNGHARIICDRDSASVYFMPDSIRAPKFTTVLIVNDEKEKGAMSGSLTYDPGYYGSVAIRQKGEQEYFRNLQTMYGSDIKISGTGIDSLQQHEFPVSVHYSFRFVNDANADVIYFSPVIGEAYETNPFKAVERKYPIEMSYPIDETYVLNMEIPTGYAVDEVPKAVRVAYNENEGIFEYLNQKSENNVQLRLHLKLNKAVFYAEEYSSLREFFSYVVKKESEQIVFKKKK